MTTTAADRMVECLLEWGVHTVFGLPGDGINGIMEALRPRQDRIRRRLIPYSASVCPPMPGQVNRGTASCDQHSGRPARRLPP